MPKSQNIGKEIATMIDGCVRDCVQVAMRHIVSSAKTVKLSQKAPAAKSAKTKKKARAARKSSLRVDYELLAEDVAVAMSSSTEPMSLKSIDERLAQRISTAQLRRAIHRLIEQKKVSQIGDRRGARYELVLGLDDLKPADPPPAS